MLLAFLLLLTKQEKAVSLLSAIITAGYGLAMVVLPLTGLCYLVAGLTVRKSLKSQPRWLLITNIIFLFVFLFFTFYINDPYYR